MVAGGVQEAPKPAGDARRALPSDVARRAQAKLLRGGLLCLAGLIVFFGVTLWKRNALIHDQVLPALTNDFVTPLQAIVNKQGGRLPIELPAVEAPIASAARRYHYPGKDDAWILRQCPDDLDVIVGHTDRFPLLIRPAEYCVVILRRGILRAEWMTESDFSRRVEAQREWIKKQKTARRTPPKLP